MRYFIFKAFWDQTDWKMCIVQAVDYLEAEAYLKRHGENGPRYVQYHGSVDSITHLK